jgi:hypothetical protein
VSGRTIVQTSVCNHQQAGIYFPENLRNPKNNIPSISALSNRELMCHKKNHPQPKTFRAFQLASFGTAVPTHLNNQLEKCLNHPQEKKTVAKQG